MLLSEPALALAGIVIVEQRGGARVPRSVESFAQLHANARVLCNVANIVSFRAVLGDEPEMLANASVTHWRAARLPRFAADGFQERVAWRENAQGKQEFNGWI